MTNLLIFLLKLAIIFSLFVCTLWNKNESHNSKYYHLVLHAKLQIKIYIFYFMCAYIFIYFFALYRIFDVYLLYQHVSILLNLELNINIYKMNISLNTNDTLDIYFSSNHLYSFFHLAISVLHILPFILL